ncbi:hypothetical protein ACOMHN_018636 [Nucella lapillus]
MGPLPKRFYPDLIGPVYAVFIASPNWDMIDIVAYETLLRWLTADNTVKVLASVFHGNGGKILNRQQGMTNLGYLFQFLEKEFPSARLIAIGPTPTYDSQEYSYGEYMSTCLLWEVQVSQFLTKKSVFLNFGSALDRVLFDKLVKSAVVKGDGWSMISFFYPILIDTLVSFFQNPLDALQDLGKVAKLILEQTLATTLEKYNDTKKHHFNATVFNNSSFYRDFREGFRRMGNCAAWVPVDTLFENTALKYYPTNLAYEAINRYYSVGREMPVQPVQWSYVYQERRETLLFEKLRKVLAATVKKEVAGLAIVAAFEERQLKEEMKEEEEEEEAAEAIAATTAVAATTPILNGMNVEELNRYHSAAAVITGEDLVLNGMNAMSREELNSYLSQIEDDIFVEPENLQEIPEVAVQEAPVLAMEELLNDFLQTSELPAVETAVSSAADDYVEAAAGGEEEEEEEEDSDGDDGDDTGMFLRSKRKISCMKEDEEKKNKRMKVSH